REKRGGGAAAVPLDTVVDGIDLEGDPAPDALFEREWRRSIFSLALERTHAQLLSTGREEHWAVLEGFDLGRLDGGRPSYAGLASPSPMSRTDSPTPGASSGNGRWRSFASSRWMTRTFGRRRAPCSGWTSDDRSRGSRGETAAAGAPRARPRGHSLQIDRAARPRRHGLGVRGGGTRAPSAPGAQGARPPRRGRRAVATEGGRGPGSAGASGRGAHPRRRHPARR